MEATMDENAALACSACSHQSQREDRRRPAPAPAPPRAISAVGSADACTTEYRVPPQLPYAAVLERSCCSRGRSAATSL